MFDEITLTTLTKYIEFFYLYILPIMFFLLLSYMIYYIITSAKKRKEVFEKIEFDFYQSVDKNRDLSRDVIMSHFNKMNHETHNLLEYIDTEIKKYLKESFEKTSNIREQISTLSREQSQLNLQFNYLQNDCKKLYKIIEQQEATIEKQDAIIRRKEKQIKRLKEDKNGI